jgi:hypothetical protein
MALLLRWVLWLTWAACVGWSWRTGALGPSGALVALALACALAAWRAGPPRRRRSALRYIEMGKQPVA